MEQTRFRPRPRGMPWRERIFLPVLLLFVVAPVLVFASLAFDTATRMRLRLGLEHNLMTARLGTRILNQECGAALETLQVLADRPEVAASLRSRNASRLGHTLRDTVELVPDVLFAAAYDARGRLVSWYPHRSAPPADVTRLDWFAQVRTSRSAVLGGLMQGRTPAPTRTVSMLIPVWEARAEGPPRRVSGTRRASPRGYILAEYRLPALTDWMADVPSTADGAVYIVDSAGRTVATAGSAPPDQRLTDYEPVRGALRYGSGAAVTPFPDGSGQALVGFSYARTCRWAVLVMQPIESAIAPTTFLVHRLSLLFVPILALIVAGVLLVFHLYDIQRDMSGLLTDQNRLLREADEAKSDFLANVSHDLRTPLASVKLSLSSLLDAEVAPSPASARDYLQCASDSVDLLTSRVRNLLAMSRIEADAVSLCMEPANLADIALTSADLVEPIAGGRIRVLLPPEPLLALCDQEQLENVIVNMLENALKYAPDAPVTLAGSLCDGSVQVSVQDRGPGIRAGDEERIFEKFYRGSGGGARGTGLGLAICKAVIAWHGGAVGARNRPGGGAEVWFTLPALAAPDMESE